MRRWFGIFGLVDENDDLVTDADEIAMHHGLLLEQKAEEAIEKFATTSASSSGPLFLYYAPQLVHSTFEAPQAYRDRCCCGHSGYSDRCGLIVMLDDALANLTCSLESNGLANDTVLFVLSDNGGEVEYNYPLRGAKGGPFDGGIRTVGFVYSPRLIPSAARGSAFDGLVSIVDWFPTIVHLACGDACRRGVVRRNTTESQGLCAGTNPIGYTALSGHTIDGINVWDALVTAGPSPRRTLLVTRNPRTGMSAYINTSVDGRLYKLVETNARESVMPLSFSFDIDVLGASKNCSAAMTLMPTPSPSPAADGASASEVSTEELASRSNTTTWMPTPTDSASPSLEPTGKTTSLPTSAGSSAGGLLVVAEVNSSGPRAAMGTETVSASNCRRGKCQGASAWVSRTLLLIAGAVCLSSPCW